MAANGGDQNGCKIRLQAIKIQIMDNGKYTGILTFVTSSTPMAALFRSPPEIPLSLSPPTMVLAHPSNPNSLSVLSVNEFSSSSDVVADNRKRAENLMASRGVDAICRVSCCSTKAICLRTLMSVNGLTGIPSKLILAEYSMFLAPYNRPANTFNKEVLPVLRKDKC
jgi:hypothetical protein